MFYNRLLKVYKHKSKQAKRLNVSCYRVYDHDLPEFPFAIELYEDKIYAFLPLGKFILAASHTNAFDAAHATSLVCLHTKCHVSDGLLG